MSERANSSMRILEQLPRWPSLVATSANRELDQALVDVRKDMIRQIEDEKTKRELPKGRASRRGPGDGGRLDQAAQPSVSMPSPLAR